MVGHVLALVAIVLFVNLGMWQLRRHEEFAARDALLEERVASEPLTLAAARRMRPDEVDLYRVTATGTYDLAGEIVLQARSFKGRSGHNVLTPLVAADGTAVLVNRGWVPIDIEGPPVVGAEPAPGEVTIVGVAQDTEVRRGVGPVDPAEGRLDRVSRVDLERIGAQSPHRLEAFYLQLVAPEPPNAFPLVLDVPQPGSGPPNISYAIQWFAFTGVVAIGYPLLLRSTSRKVEEQAGQA
jgi:surfeit locus 1 family protein